MADLSDARGFLRINVSNDIARAQPVSGVPPSKDHCLALVFGSKFYHTISLNL